MTNPARIRIVEVGPRDGLQNESAILPTEIRLELIDGLVRAGVTHIEAGSFVHPAWVPQMAGCDELFAGLRRTSGVRYAALIPNIKGFERAMRAGADEVAVFAAASETFSQKNINCSIGESLNRFAPIFEAAQALQIPVRGYVSCVAGCPYEGEVATSAVRDLAAHLYQAGCSEICLADTTGIGTPGDFQRVLSRVLEQVPLRQLAIHCHDTYGQALANIHACLQMGVAVFDSAIAGLGGCPYAKGASGNVATEDLVYMLRGMGIETGIDLAQLILVGNTISRRLGRSNQAHTARAMSQ